MEVNTKFEIINKDIFSRKLSKANPMEASAIAWTVKENICHESLCESFWHVSDTVFKLYIP